MKILVRILIISFLLCNTVEIVAQNNTPQYFLSQLPSLPDNFCGATHDEMVGWNDRVFALGDKMKELHNAEKYTREELLAAAKPNLAIYEPSNEAILEILKKNLEEAEALSEKANSILNELITVYGEKKGDVTNKHFLILNPLRKQRGEATAQGKNTSAIDKKISAGEMEECKELAVVRREFLLKYREILDKLVEYGIRADKLVDETNGIIYTSYTFKTKYGFWLETLMAYADELTDIYSTFQLINPDKENM